MSAREMKRESRAFVYINVKAGKERKILDELMKYDEVIEAHLITGQYDVLTVLEIKREIFEAPQEKILSVVEKIRKLGDIKETNTVVPAFSVTKR